MTALRGVDPDVTGPPVQTYAIATVMRETYLTFTRWTSLIAIVMWVLALIFSLLGN